VIDKNLHDKSGENCGEAANVACKERRVTLAVTITDTPTCVVVRLEGMPNTETVQQMQFALMRLIARRTSLAVLDLSELMFLTSLAMGCLVSFRRDLARWDGRVKLAGVRPEVHEALALSRLSELFEFCPSVEAAMAT